MYSTTVQSQVHKYGPPERTADSPGLGTTPTPALVVSRDVTVIMWGLSLILVFELFYLILVKWTTYWILKKFTLKEEFEKGRALSVFVVTFKMYP